MFGSDIIDVALGACLVFLMASLICTAVQEGLEGILKMRAMDLERGIRELLSDPAGSSLAKTFYDHPMIFSLFSGSYDPAHLRDSFLSKINLGEEKVMSWWSRRNLPSYIPAANFSNALLDIIARGDLQGMPYPVAAGALPTVDDLRTAASKLPTERLQRAVLVAIDHADGEVTKVKTNLESWFNSTMERVSGGYKRRTQLFLFLIGLTMAGLLNIDAMYVVDRLSHDKALRQAVVTQAEKMVPSGANQNGAELAELQKKSFEQLNTQLTDIGLPVGWPAKQAQPSCVKKDDKAGAAIRKLVCECPTTLAWMIIGWLITALAVMLGAPFWFDALSKLVLIRGTVKPKEKKDDKEAPEPAPGGELTMPPKAAPVATTKPAADVAFEPHAWKDVAAKDKHKGDL